MATFLLYRDTSHGRDRNSNGRNAVLVNGADEAAARAAAAPDGETKVHPGWIALQVAATDSPTSPIWFEGDAVTPTGRFRGQ